MSGEHYLPICCPLCERIRLLYDPDAPEDIHCEKCEIDIDVLHDMKPRTEERTETIKKCAGAAVLTAMGALGPQSAPEWVPRAEYGYYSAGWNDACKEIAGRIKALDEKKP